MHSQSLLTVVSRVIALLVVMSALQTEAPARTRAGQGIAAAFNSERRRVMGASEGANSSNHHLVPLDYIREMDGNASRAGIVDRVITKDSGQGGEDELGICHVGLFIPFTFMHSSGRMYLPTASMAAGVLAAAHLAIDMLNKGDGSVVKEVAGLNERCPIRFTGEAFDTAYHQALTAKTVTGILDRKTPEDREVCAFVGAVMSTVTIPMAILTGLAGRPQLSPWSTSSQLDDVQTFPLFGRTVTSELGLVVPLIHYLREKKVQHLGVVHWNDEYGNAYLESLLQTATKIYPELKVVAVDIPSAKAATQSDYMQAVDILAKTQFRWFFALIGQDVDYEPMMLQAVEKGIAGTGKHVWIMNSAGGIDYFTGLTYKKGSPLASTTKGLGMFSAQNGRAGMEVFDKFVKRWKMLNNAQDMEFLDSRLPRYPDEPDFVRRVATSEALTQDPSVIASTYFDETILLGLSACKAAAQGDDDIEVDGKTMFDFILNTTFDGATGNVTLDSKGSRLPETALFRITNVIEVPVNETHVTFRVQDSDIFVGGKWVQEIPFVYNDGTTRIPHDLPEVEMDYNHIGTALRATGLAMTAFILILSLVFAGWTHHQRKVHVVRASQPIFLLILCAGAFILGATIIPLSIDDEIANEDVCNISCMVSPWLASVGFTLIWASLTSKTWRVNKLFRHPDMHRIKLSAADVMGPLLIMLLVNLVVLSIWTVVSPLEWVREETEEDVFGRPQESHGHCTADDFLPFVIVLVVVDLGALVFASHQSYLARGIATEFAETESIGRVLTCMLLVSFVGVPTMILVSEDPKAMYFVLVSIIFVLCTAVLLFIFVPKMMAAVNPSFNMTGAVRRSSDALRHNAPPSFVGSIMFTGETQDPSDTPVEGIQILNKPRQPRIDEVGKLREQNRGLKKRVAELEALLGPAHDDEVGKLREQNGGLKQRVVELEALLASSASCTSHSSEKSAVGPEEERAPM